MDGDAEGVWSPDIEQSFQEALAIYPPCGRRKIILSDEGKMYGRNELIARYIKLRTGKTRTRKQVSSHLQVLARRKSREIQSKLKDQASKDKALQNMAALSSAQIVSPSLIKTPLPPMPPSPYPPAPRFWPTPIPGQPGPSQELVLKHNPGRTPGLGCTSFACVVPILTSPQLFQHQAICTNSIPIPDGTSSAPVIIFRDATYEPLAPPPPPVATAVPVWQDRTIASSKLRLLEYSAFMEVPQDQDSYSKHLFVHIGQTNPSYSDPLLEAVDIRQIYDKFPEKKGGLKELYEKGPQNAFFLVKFWADLNSSSVQDGPGSFYGVSSQYSSSESMTITVSTKVCSFGKQVVEKVETEYAHVEGGKCLYRIHRSPMCGDQQGNAGDSAVYSCRRVNTAHNTTSIGSLKTSTAPSDWSTDTCCFAQTIRHTNTGETTPKLPNSGGNAKKNKKTKCFASVLILRRFFIIEIETALLPLCIRKNGEFESWQFVASLSFPFTRCLSLPSCPNKVKNRFNAESKTSPFKDYFSGFWVKADFGSRCLPLSRYSRFLILIRVPFFTETAIDSLKCLLTTSRRTGVGTEKAIDSLNEIMTKQRTRMFNEGKKYLTP
ncbi:hypothetical protein DNTS_021533 [Danionella cerebrum]|uniref:TEA domain-containing protein n=1 Tax=Danionella cerebrum TaxID=2873325 RepID=A0A553QIB4_9TELE|nr:hypothetical protein DNTS_021533 [Danionella translucida]